MCIIQKLIVLISVNKMKLLSFYSITPNSLLGLIHRNKEVKWIFTFNPIAIYLHEEDSDVFFQTLYTDNLANRLLSLTKKFNNLKYVNHGI